MPEFLNNQLLHSLGLLILRNILDAGIIWICYSLIVQRNIHLQHKVKHRAALVSLVLIAGLFIYSIFSPFQSKEFTALTISPGFMLTKQSVRALDWLFPLVSIIYFLLLGYVLLPFGFQISREYKLIQTSFGDQYWQAITDQLAKSMKVGRAVRFALHQNLMSPSTIGLLKPMILFPVSILNQLTPKQVEAVIAHELAHIRRFDFFTNILISFIEKLLIINPFAQLLAATIRKEAELACDAEVLTEDHHPLLYAESLFLLEKSRHDGQIGIAFTGSKGMLLERIGYILGKRHHSTHSGKFWLMLPVILILYSFLYADFNNQFARVHEKSVSTTILPSKNDSTTLFLNSELTILSKSVSRRRIPLANNRKSSVWLRQAKPISVPPEISALEKSKESQSDLQSDLFVLEKQLPPDPRDRKERSIVFFSEENPLSALKDSNIESEIQKAFELAVKARGFKLDPSIGPILKEYDRINSPEIPPVIFIQTPKELRKQLIPSEQIRVIIHSDGIIEMHE
jgi:beta-lactamase regulating signal transducer with metallopeptidase domain